MAAPLKQERMSGSTFARKYPGAQEQPQYRDNGPDGPVYLYWIPSTGRWLRVSPSAGSYLVETFEGCPC